MCENCPARVWKGLVTQKTKGKAGAIFFFAQ